LQEITVSIIAKGKLHPHHPCIKKGDSYYEINFRPDRTVPLGNFLDAIAEITANGVSVLLTVRNTKPRRQYPVNMTLLQLPLHLPKAKRTELVRRQSL
jgi:hypothetical protein